MAVKTDFSTSDFKKILSQYSLGTCTNFEPISQGTVQTNYRIQTMLGKYIFRYYENRVRESVLFEIELLKYLKAHQYPCPAPIPDQAGTSVGIYHGKPFVLFEFIEGYHIQQPEEQHLTQLTQKAAELGSITRGYQPHYVPYRLNYDISHCRELAKKEAEKSGTQDAYAKFAWLDSQLADLDLPDDLPKGICHCDFHFSNVLFQEDQFVGLIDFDDANYTYLIFDLINLIDYWAWPFQSDCPDLLASRKIAQIYHEYRPLDGVEQRHLFDVHKLGILIDCIWYFGRGSSDNFYEKRKIKYLDDLGRDQYAIAHFPE